MPGTLHGPVGMYSQVLEHGGVCVPGVVEPGIDAAIAQVFTDGPGNGPGHESGQNITLGLSTGQELLVETSPQADFALLSCFCDLRRQGDGALFPVDVFPPGQPRLFSPDPEAKEHEQVQRQGASESGALASILLPGLIKDVPDLRVCQDHMLNLFACRDPAGGKGGERIVVQVSRGDLVVECAFEVLDVFPDRGHLKPTLPEVL